MAIDKIYKDALKQLEEQRGSGDDPRRAMGCIQAVKPTEGIMAFCRRTGISLPNANFNRADILTFMSWNTASLKYYQDVKNGGYTTEERKIDEYKYLYLKTDEVFFCKNPNNLELPANLPFWDFGTIKGYSVNTPLPDNWVWDIEYAFEEYDNIYNRLTVLYRTLPNYDGFGVVKFDTAQGVRYRAILHIPDIATEKQILKTERTNPVPEVDSKRKTEKQKWHEGKQYKPKPKSSQLEPIRKPNKSKEKQPTKKEEITVFRPHKRLPDAWGYSLDLGITANIGLFDLAGHTGLNYLVFSRGAYAGVPYEYFYYGIQGIAAIGDPKNFPKKFKSWQAVIDALKDKFSDTVIHTLKSKWRQPTKLLKGFLVSLSGTFSPFVAWKNDIDGEINPSSWEGWFVAKTGSISIECEIGITGGMSEFSGRSFKDIPNLEDQRNPFIAEMRNYIFVLPPQSKEWYGGTIDIGVAIGAGLSISYSDDYISFYKCNSTQVMTKDLGNLEYIARWAHFLAITHPTVASLSSVIDFVAMLNHQKNAIDMKKEQKIIAKKSLFSKIPTILYYFFMLTWPLWIILPVVYYDAQHNAINSPHKTVGVVYKVGTSRVWHIYIMYYVNNEKYRTIVNPSKYGHNEIDTKENINDWVGLKLWVSYLPENPGEYYYVHTDSAITDAFPNKNSLEWERVDSLYRIYQKTQ